MSRAGLHKVTKTVKGGKRRAYWVKSEVPVVRAAGRALANKHVQTGLKSPRWSEVPLLPRTSARSTWASLAASPWASTKA